MPESDYMNERQLAFFKERLKQLEQDILANAGETTEHLETQFVPDPADRATIEEEHALELRTRDRERKLLKKVQQSIARIDSGEYGWCEETGEPIGIPACWPAPRPPCRWKRRNAAKCVKNSTAIEFAPKRLRASRAPLRTRRFRLTPSATRFPCIFSVVRTGHVTRFPLGQTLSSPSLSMECVSWAVFLVARTVVGTQVVRINKAGSRKTCPIRFL